jgi:hypothetical protein
MTSNRRRNRWVALIAATFVGAGVCSAQTRPMPPDPYDPNSMSQPAPANSNAAPAPTNSYQGPSDYPSAEINQVPAAKARETVARAVYDRARSALYTTVDSVYEDFHYSPQFQAALRDEKNAHEAFDVSRDRALAGVASDPRYRALKELAAQMSRKLEVLHEHPQQNREQILATASVKLDYTSRMSEMESDALASDQAVQSARTRLVEAAARVADMRGQFKRQARRDSTFLAARSNMDNAQIAYLGANAYFEYSIDAATIALDYAYWVHRYDPYNYYPWGYVTNYGGYYPSYSSAALYPAPCGIRY